MMTEFLFLSKMSLCPQNEVCSLTIWFVYCCRNPERSQPFLRGSNGAQGFVPLLQLSEVRRGLPCLGVPHVSSQVQVGHCQHSEELTLHYLQYTISFHQQYPQQISGTLWNSLESSTDTKLRCLMKTTQKHLNECLPLGIEK